jgi:hypothetical protein
VAALLRQNEAGVEQALLEKVKGGACNGRPFCTCSTFIDGIFVNRNAKGFSCWGSPDNGQKAKPLITTVYSHLLILSYYISLSVYFSGCLGLSPNAINNGLWVV